MKTHPLQKTHIVHIIPTLKRGGAERLVVDLANSANRKKYIVSIITFSSDVPLAKHLKPDVMLHVLEKRGKYNIRFYKRLRSYLTGVSPDIVHTHLYGADVWGSLAASAFHIPIVSTEHNVNEDEPTIKTWFKRSISRFIDHHVAISSAVEQDLNNRYQVPSSYISHIPNGVQTANFTKIPLVTSAKSSLNILVVGRLEEQKGHALLFDMLALEPSLSYKLTILGSGSLKSALKKQAKALGIARHITWKAHSDNMKKEYKAHDIVVIPSLWEGFGLVCIEAMASGRIVLASNVGGLREIITNRKTGLLFDIHSPTSFYSALSWIQQKSDKIPVLTKAAREKVVKDYDISSVSASYDALYDQLLSV